MEEVYNNVKTTHFITIALYDRLSVGEKIIGPYNNDRQLIIVCYVRQCDKIYIYICVCEREREREIIVSIIQIFKILLG